MCLCNGSHNSSNITVLARHSIAKEKLKNEGLSQYEEIEMICDICKEDRPVRDLDPSGRGTLARGAVKVCEYCYFIEKDNEEDE